MLVSSPVSSLHPLLATVSLPLVPNVYVYLLMLVTLLPCVFSSSSLNTVSPLVHSQVVSLSPSSLSAPFTHLFTHALSY